MSFQKKALSEQGILQYLWMPNTHGFLVTQRLTQDSHGSPARKAYGIGNPLKRTFFFYRVAVRVGHTLSIQGQVTIIPDLIECVTNSHCHPVQPPCKAKLYISIAVVFLILQRPVLISILSKIERLWLYFAAVQSVKCGKLTFREPLASRCYSHTYEVCPVPPILNV